MDTAQFLLVVGKDMTDKQPKYYDIPKDGLIWKLLLSLTDRDGNRGSSWWRHRSEAIFKKSPWVRDGGVINHLRITKTKWIEEQPLTLIEKQTAHTRMNHSHLSAIQYYM